MTADAHFFCASATIHRPANDPDNPTCEKAAILVVFKQGRRQGIAYVSQITHLDGRGVASHGRRNDGQADESQNGLVGIRRYETPLGVLILPIHGFPGSPLPGTPWVRSGEGSPATRETWQERGTLIFPNQR